MARLKKSTVRLIIAIIFYFCYLLLGAAVFLRIERPKEEVAKLTLKNTYRQFLDQHRNCLTEFELEEFVKKVAMAGNRGIKASVFNEVDYEPNWNFGQSLFFAATTLTTIGYGHVTRLSSWGKVFCILYVLVGIPYTLILLTAILDRLGNYTSRLLKWMNYRFGQYYQPFKIRLFHLGLIFLFVVFSFFIIPSIIFCIIEPYWSFLDSFYYCFISFTTIGYGDYVPAETIGQHHRTIYKIIVTVFLLIGLIFMALLLSIAYEIPQLNLSNMLINDDDEDTERVTLNPNEGGPGGPKYARHIDEVESPQGQSIGGGGDIRTLHN